MAAGGPSIDPYRFARISAAALCFAAIFFLVVASIFQPGFHVDSIVFTGLLVTGCALLAVELRLWGSS